MIHRDEKIQVNLWNHIKNGVRASKTENHKQIPDLKCTCTCIFAVFLHSHGVCKRCNASAYHTRNSQDYNVPVCRLQIYKSSFVPTVVNEWNSLPLDTRDSSSLSLFKNKTSKSLTVAPPYFSNGKRSTNILHTRLRHNCALNIDLHRCNIILSPLCSCGMIEDAHQFFFSCPKYATVREEFFNKFLRFDKIHILESRTLLWGDDSLSVDDNKYLFSIVQIYIQGTGRFK